MGRIRILPDSVANKISAGEVVERPASAVKELLENSLDAQASRMRIELESGGKRRIQIVDDGVGMGRDDAMLAFERHATSKLRQAQDLFAISTLGFRGEALPSIAAVSRLLLDSRCEEEEAGTRIEIAGGKMLNVQEHALPRGTSIVVRDLFYNVPARRKFLRSVKTELAHIASLVTHYSLAHIDKSFHLTHDRSELLNVTPVETLRERVYQVFGGETLEQLVELDSIERELEIARPAVPPSQAVGAVRGGETETERKKFRLGGFISTPQIQKLNRNSIYIFVNRRLIRDRLLLHAISSAYYNLMPSGCFPFALLFLEMDSGEVDVNVHPAKTEVRFRHQSFVHDFVRDSIRERLIESKPVSTFTLPASEAAQARAQPATAIPFSESTELARQAEALPASDFALRPEPPPPRGFEFSQTAPIEVPATAGGPTAFGSAAAGASPPTAPTAPTAVDLDAAASALADTLTVDDAPHSSQPVVHSAPASLERLGELRPLGQIKESFIVAAGADGLWIIDQHVAHERILFEKVLRQRASGEIESQRLLMPIIVTLKPDQQIVFAEIESEFGANGFELEPFGHGTVAVKAAPAGVSPRQVETLIGEILDTPERQLRALSLSDLQRTIAAAIACHAAIKVNTALDAAKMQWLLEELAKTDCPMSCPHGRPIALKYPLREILKAFHRI